MADITVQFKDKKTGEVSETTIPEQDLKANKEQNPDYTVTVIGAGLSPAEQDPVLAQVKAQRQKETGLAPTILGGILQGVSLETVDELKGTDKTLAKRQEAENPVTYNVSKFLGSLAPTAAAGYAGAQAGAPTGAAIGGLIGGPPGAALGGSIGAVGGAMLGAAGAGTAESYFSKPEAERELTMGDIGMGALSAAGEGAGKFLASGINKIGRKLGLGSLTKEEAALELVKKAESNATTNAAKLMLIPEQINQIKKIQAAVELEANALNKRRDELVQLFDEVDASKYDQINNELVDIEEKANKAYTNYVGYGDAIKRLENEAEVYRLTVAPNKAIGRGVETAVDKSLSQNLQRSPFGAAPQLVPNAPMSQEDLAAYNQAIVGEAMQRLQAEKVAGLNAPAPLLFDEAEFAKQFKR